MREEGRREMREEGRREKREEGRREEGEEGKGKGEEEKREDGEGLHTTHWRAGHIQDDPSSRHEFHFVRNVLNIIEGC